MPPHHHRLRRTDLAYCYRKSVLPKPDWTQTKSVTVLSHFQHRT